MTPNFITEIEFGELFDRFEHTAFRLETQDTYLVKSDQKRFQDWLAGEAETNADDGKEVSEWHALVRAAVQVGKLVKRVRVVSEPHTDYTRWLLRRCRHNIMAGEDIRYLPRSQADGLALPHEDYWLIDSSYALVLHFDGAGILQRFELDEDPASIVRRNYWRDVAWHHATTWKEYAAKHLRS